LVGVITNQFVEIICVGNELLIGKTLNTNAQWLTKRVTTLGLNVKRITVVGDNLLDISTAIKEAIQRKPCFVLTTGGLGPTFDDMTLEGLAKALDVQTKIDDKALKMIADKYYSYAQETKMDKIELTSYRIKMAKIPEGSKPLPNAVGTAPAVMIKHENITVFALPGVPFEMKSIFDETLVSILKKAGHGIAFFEASVTSANIMESEMAPVVDDVMKNNPNVYIKSHPKGAETNPFIEFHLSTTAKDTTTAKKCVNKALAQLTELIKAKGGTITDTKRED